MKNSTIVKLFKNLPGKFSAIIWMTTTTVIINLTSLVLPLFFMQVYDRIIPNSSIETLIYLTVGAVTLILIETVLTLGRGFLSNWYSANFAYQNSTNIISGLFSKSSSSYKTSSIAGYFQSFRSVEKLKKIFSNQLFQTLLDLPFIILFLLAIYFIAGKLVIFHLVTLFIYTIYVIVSHFYIDKRKSSFNKTNNNKFDFLRKILSKNHQLKASGIEEPIIRKLELVLSGYSREYFLMKKANSTPGQISGAISQFMIYGTIIIGGILYSEGELTLGIISAATMLARRTVKPLVSIYKLSMSISEAKQDFKNLEDVVSKSNTTKEVTPNITSGNIEIKDLTLNSRETGYLNNINLKMNKYSITAIEAESIDSAESLIDIILGIEKPDSGEIIIDSIKLSSIDNVKELPGVSVIYQDPVIFAGTLLENITLFNNALNLQAFNIASYLGMDKLVAKLPMGYETPLTPNSKFSLTGELIHKISIARAITKKPKVLILFNADKYMNSDTLNRLKTIIQNLKYKSTILMVSANRDFLKMADKRYILENGELSGVSNGS